MAWFKGTVWRIWAVRRCRIIALIIVIIVVNFSFQKGCLCNRGCQ